ncbi:MAG: hypothetical protein WEA59_01115, partial [Ferruginibacter sp.]
MTPLLVFFHQQHQSSSDAVVGVFSPTTSTNHQTPLLVFFHQQHQPIIRRRCWCFFTNNINQSS